MIGKILKIDEIIKLSKQLNLENRSIVLAGGCFDILHTGHVAFLNNAKEKGDVLIVILESDESIKDTKGATRPINDQESRAFVLSALTAVDYIVLLPKLESDKAYDQLISQIKPDIIATTKGDPNRHHKERQANLIGAKLIEVTSEIANQSTTRVAELLRQSTF